MLGSVATQVAGEDSRKERLREIIEKKSLITGKTFTLSSGRESNFFVNLKQTMLDPEGSNLLADLVLDIMGEHGIRCIGGLEMGAVPLVASICTKSYPDHPVRAFFVRKMAKEHGAKEQIDGHVSTQGEVLVIDDVVTSGQSVMVAVEAARARGATVNKVLAIVDRQEGARENLEAAGLELIALFDRGDFPAVGA